MYENIAWNNFERTGNIESFLEYMQIQKVKKDLEQKSQIELDGIMNEVDKGEGDSNKRNNI